MNTTHSIPRNENETLNYINDNASQLDEQRKQELNNLKQIQEVSNEISRLERDRLAAKYGEDHPAVQKFDDRMAYNQEAIPQLDQEIQKADIKVPEVDMASWMLHGRVLDKGFKPVQDLTVSLFDEKQNWVRILGIACTDARGYFSLIYPPKGKNSEIPAAQPLFIRVSNKDSKILYRDTEPVFVKAGQIDYREIILPGGEESCAPPVKEDPGTLPQLPPDAWVVRGSVKDEANKGIGGLTVSLYDKELIFDDVLGTTITDKNGNFKIIYNTEAFKGLFEKKPDIYLKVLDNKGKVLHTSRQRISPQAGREEHFTVNLKQRKSSR